MNEEELLIHYEENKDEINSRLKEFQTLRDAPNERLFKELIFVILTSQSSARNAWDASNDLQDQELLVSPEERDIRAVLEQNEIQFEERKAQYIVKNFEFLSQPTFNDSTKGLKIKSRIKPDNLDKTREWVVGNVKGLSWKGASHFLRNIGYGNDFAIISRPLISILYELDVINTSEMPSSKEEYLDVEAKVQQFSQDMGIDVLALDLAIWSYNTGEVFK